MSLLFSVGEIKSVIQEKNLLFRVLFCNYCFLKRVLLSLLMQEPQL